MQASKARVLPITPPGKKTYMQIRMPAGIKKTVATRKNPFRSKKPLSQAEKTVKVARGVRIAAN
jgi:hypothetical protein